MKLYLFLSIFLVRQKNENMTYPKQWRSQTLHWAKLLTYELPLPPAQSKSVCENLLHTDCISK